MLTTLLLVVLTGSAQATTGKRGLLFNNPATYLQHWNGTGAEVSWAYN